MRPLTDGVIAVPSQLTNNSSMKKLMTISIGVVIITVLYADKIVGHFSPGNQGALQMAQGFSYLVQVALRVVYLIALCVAFFRALTSLEFMTGGESLLLGVMVFFATLIAGIGVRDIEKISPKLVIIFSVIALVAAVRGFLEYREERNTMAIE